MRRLVVRRVLGVYRRVRSNGKIQYRTFGRREDSKKMKNDKFLKIKTNSIPYACDNNIALLLSVSKLEYDALGKQSFIRSTIKTNFIIITHA